MTLFFLHAVQNQAQESLAPPQNICIHSLFPVDLLICTPDLSVKHLDAALCPPMKIKQLFVLFFLLKMCVYNPTLTFLAQVSILFFP